MHLYNSMCIYSVYINVFTCHITYVYTYNMYHLHLSIIHLYKYHAFMYYKYHVYIYIYIILLLMRVDYCTFLWLILGCVHYHVVASRRLPADDFGKSSCWSWCGSWDLTALRKDSLVFILHISNYFLYIYTQMFNSHA